LESVARAVIDKCGASASIAMVRLGLQANTEALVLSDPELTELLVYNLTSTAIHASRRGWSVLLRIECRDHQAAIAIIDQGPPYRGVDEQFTRDAQLECKLNPNGRYARGLGLYFVNLVAKHFDAKIDLSHDGEHTTARVWFPLAP
jgi:anti-sigma regulatory factor (Ser/Thr protein kinase)